MGEDTVPEPSRLKTWIAIVSQPNSRLVKAVKQNRTMRLRSILMNPIQKSLILPESFTLAFNIVVEKRFNYGVPLLLIHGPRPDQDVVDQITHLAMERSDSYILKTLNQQGLYPQSEVLRSSLTQAIKQPSWNLLKLLVNFPSNQDITTLNIALKISLLHGSLGTSTFLLGEGADYQPNAEDFEEQGLLTLLGRKAIPVRNVVLLRWLFGKGVDPWLVYGSTGPDIAGTLGRPASEVVEVLTECGGRPEQRILLAALYGRIASVKALLEEGVPINSTDKFGNSVLHFGIQRIKNETMQDKVDKAEVCSYLISNGADVELSNHSNQTPLKLAVSGGRAKTSGELLDAGAKMDRQTLSIAVRASQNRVIDKTIMEHLLDHGANHLLEELDGMSRTAVHEAAQFGKASTVGQLLAAGANIQTVDDRGWSALHFASSQDRPGSGEIIKLLTEKGLAIDAADHEGRRPLHIAAGSQNYHSMWQLRKLGATCDLTTKTGKTADQLISDWDMKEMWLKTDNIDIEFPLLDYARAGQEEMVLKLLKCGADVGVVDADGNTVLHFFNNSIIKKKLILSGANPYIKNKNNQLSGTVHKNITGNELGMVQWRHDYFAGVQYPGPGLEEGWEVVFATVPRSDGSGGGLSIPYDMDGTSMGYSVGGGWDGGCGDGGGGGGGGGDSGCG